MSLPAKVQDLLTNKLDKTVYIRADARAKYQAVEDVVDNLRAAGVDQLGLDHRELRRAPAQAASRDSGAVDSIGFGSDYKQARRISYGNGRRRREAGPGEHQRDAAH